jgi:DNA polymerase
MIVVAHDDPRVELASIAAALRAYVEWHRESGTLGFPRKPWQRPAVEGAPVEQEESMPEDLAVPQAPQAPAPAVAQAPVAAVPPAPAPVERPVVPLPVLPDVDRRVRLPEMVKEVEACRKCSLCRERKRPAFARGEPEARVMFVGEAPGVDDDKQGRPFVGDAGKQLDRMIRAMGISAEKDVYICNVIKCRPPGNRRPEPEEIAACVPYLHDQIAMVRPRVIVALGNVAISAVLDTKQTVDQLRGAWRLYRAHTLVMPTYHPSKLLREGPEQAETRKKVWEDIQMVMKELDLKLPKRPEPKPEGTI